TGRCGQPGTTAAGSIPHAHKENGDEPDSPRRCRRGPSDQHRGPPRRGAWGTRGRHCLGDAPAWRPSARGPAEGPADAGRGHDLSRQVADRSREIQEGPMTPAAAVTSEVREVLTHMVHPEGWQDNGGNMASTAVFGSKLFIKAPKRYHTEIQWVIDELPKGQ